LLPDGTKQPDQERSQVKADQFFALAMHTVGGIVQIDGRPVGAAGQHLKANKYLDGDVG
jgi:hypothetical protein